MEDEVSTHVEENGEGGAQDEESKRSLVGIACGMHKDLSSPLDQETSYGRPGELYLVTSRADTHIIVDRVSRSRLALSQSDFEFRLHAAVEQFREAESGADARAVGDTRGERPTSAIVLWPSGVHRMLEPARASLPAAPPS